MADVSQARPTATREAIAPAAEIAIYDNLPAVEAIWRSLEQSGVLTPYQRFDWIAALVAAGAESDSRIAVAVLHSGDRPFALLPLGLVRRRGLVQAHILGARQSNSDWLLADASFAPTRNDLLDIFQHIGQTVGGIDLLSFSNLPKSWQGHTNLLLALDHAPAASNLYAATIGPTPVPYIEHRLTAKRRSNINRGRRRLEEQHGAVRLVHVQDAQTLQTVHAAFLEQRGTRFAEMGISNMFAQPPFMQLFRDLTLQSFGSDRPALCLHALYSGEEIVATSWGLQAGSHYSQYINSTTSGPASRYSLMGILVAELMDALTVTGITTFDMGLGDFDYKVEWTEAQTVFNSQVALSLKGRVAAAAKARLGAGKRLIKQTPALWRATQGARRLLFRLRGR